MQTRKQRREQSAHAKRPAHVIAAILALAMVALAVMGGVYVWHRHQANATAQKAKSSLVTMTRTVSEPTVASSSSDSEPPSTVDPTIQAVLQGRLAPLHFNGTAIIVRGGKLVASYASGTANAGTGQKNSLGTLYEINSIQKSLTAALIMKQISAGKLAMSTKLSQFFPQFPAASQVTVQELLTMTSGYRPGQGYGPRPYVNDQQAVAAMASTVRFDPAQHRRFSYAGLNYNILCGILAKVSGKQYPQNLHEVILDPLKLNAATFAYDQLPQTAALGYRWPPKAALADFSAAYTTSATQAHFELGTGQLYMNCMELYHAEKALQDGTILTPAEKKTLYTRLAGTNSSYAGGLYQSVATQRRAQGYGYGFTGFMRISRDGQNAVIFLTNTTKAPDKYPFLKIADSLAKEYI
ncbi:serine hydrolase domain-containing protein [Lacticaseibacillus mingshuiensis]|uniref:serine hydrolase domain-containing protein n=1 Tax=Lacticaseibacillus mingshuiensis TaxID=2799574 RepID=UPI00194F848B|nr:serine hydrolase domain-containing protein [Lacticaseibacillus mingshuiensis]